MCFGPVCVRRDERQVDLVLLRRGKGDLGLLGLFLDALEGVGLLREIDAGVLLELVDDPIHEAIVPVVAAEVRVAVGGLDLENAVADLEHGNVERAAAEVVDGDLLVLLLVETVGQRSGGRLVDDAQHLQAGDLPGVLGRLALGVVEVGGDRDDGLRDLLAELALRRRPSASPESSPKSPAAKRFLLATDLDLNVRVAVGASTTL